MKFPALLSPIAIAVLFSACQSVDCCVEPVNNNPPNLRTLSAGEAKISSSANNFAFDLFHRTSKPNENTFISPLSVSVALGMVMNGASPETKQSILNTIDYGDLTAEQVNQSYKDLTALLLSMDKKVTMDLANSVWYSQEYTIVPSFSTTVDNYYDGRVQGLDFSNSESVGIINKWVEDKTNERIKNLIGNIDADDVMILINAIYFKGDWTYAFDKSKTYSTPFYLENGTTTSTKMMYADEVSLKCFSNEQVQLIDIPYGNEQFRFTILMPQGETKLADLSQMLDADILDIWLSKSFGKTTEFEMPRFKMEWKRDLLSVLEDMGLHAAGYTELTQDDLDYGISCIIHQSFIDVNEVGTEAAAATAIGIEVTSLPEILRVDRPFIFLIREKHSNTVLFMGQFISPTEQ
jgi:serine protease inhibitor